MPILWRTSLSSRLPYRRRGCQNCNDNDHKEGFNRESSTSSSIKQNPNNRRVLTQTRQGYSSQYSSKSTLAPISNSVRLNISMRCQAKFLEKTIFMKCYVTDRNINLVGLEWIDELNPIHFPNENGAGQTLTLEPTNAEHLVRGCNQCLHIAKIPHPSIHIQL
ncbi:hypothetical protein ACTXT7_016285 [Hymenolepis weldensis]